MKMNFNDIIITPGFAATMPHPDKMEECRYWWNTFRRMDRYLVVNDMNELIDGYVLYCVLKENGFSGDVPIKRSNRKKRCYYRKNVETWKNSYLLNPTLYVFGKHYPNGREYCWKVLPKHLHMVNDYGVGDKCLVKSKHGFHWVTITRMETFAQCPVKFPVKNVSKFSKV